MSECRDVREALSRGEDPSGPRFASHLRECAACREVTADGGRLGQALGDPDAPAPAEDLDALFRGVEQRVQRDRGPLGRLRALPSPMRLALGALSIAALVLLVLALAPRPDLAVYPVARMALALGLPGGVALIALGAALRPLHRPALPASWSWSLVVLALVAPVVLSLLPQAHAAHPRSLLAPEATPAEAFRCFGMGVLAALPVAGLVHAFRRASLIPSILLGAAAAGLAGFVTLQGFCPQTHPLHLLVGHATVVLVAVGVGVGVSAAIPRR